MNANPQPRFGAPVLSGIAWLALSACGASQDSSRPLNIFGTDDRTDVDVGTAPGSAVGRLDSGCTGTLIGTRLVLTAAHCVVDSTNGSIKPLVTYFRPSYARDTAPESFWIEQVWLGSERPEQERPRDFAILKLDRDAASRFGRVDVSAVTFGGGSDPSVTLIGYSSDRSGGASASQHRGCAVREVNQGRLFHDCDATAGVSGGPLIASINGQNRIVGISVSEFRRGAAGSVTRDTYTSEYANVAVPATTFATAVQELLETVDRGQPAPPVDGVTTKPNPNTRPDNPGPGRTLQDVRSGVELRTRAEWLVTIAASLGRNAYELADLGEENDAHELHMSASALYRAARGIEQDADDVSRGRLSGEQARRALFARYEASVRELQSIERFPGFRDRPHLNERLDRVRRLISQGVKDVERELFIR